MLMLILYLVLFLMGVFTLASRQIKLTQSKVIGGKYAILIGAILFLLPIGMFLADVAVGFNYPGLGAEFDGVRLNLLYGKIIAVCISLVVIFIIAFVGARDPNASKFASYVHDYVSGSDVEGPNPFKQKADAAKKAGKHQ